MDPKERLQIIKQKIQQLTELDKSRAIFGSSNHKFEIRPVLTMTELQQFQEKYKLELPWEYKLFLTEISNGGVGPYYGLYSLFEGIKEANSYSTDGNSPLDNSFTIDFPFNNKVVEEFINYYNTCIDDGENDEIEYFNVPDKFTGVIFLSEYGCGWSYVLVVKGEQSGTVWFHGENVSPVLAEGKQWSFFDWYENWLDNSIYELNPVKEKKDIGNDCKILDYTGWKLEKVPSEVLANKNLKKLVFSSNSFKEFPMEILALKELKTIDFSMTPIVKIPDEIAELTNLKKLKLNYNYHNTLPDSLNKLEHLEELSMYYNYKIKEIPEVVGKINNLKKIHFSNCGELSKIHENIGDLIHLETLLLNDCPLLDSLPKSIGNLQNLKCLYLGNTRITKLPDSFRNLVNLEILGIDIDLLDLKNAVEIIKDLPKLHTLKIVNQVDFPASFAELSNIKTLYVNQNGELYRSGHLKLPLHESIALIPNLEELDLMNNNQVNQLPENFGNLKNLKKLELSSTSIQVFPDSMKSLLNLDQVNGNLNTDKKSPFGVLPNEKEKLIKWFPNAKISIW